MPIDAQPPSPEQQNPYLPPGPPPFICDKWQGVDTSTTRPGVKDEQTYWMDGLMPIGPLAARILPDVGPTLWSAPLNAKLAFFDFANIGATPYAIAFHADGGIWAINTITAVAAHIAPDATIQNVIRGAIGVSQWGSQYVIIVSKQSNGYFLWDGTNFYQAGSLGPGVTITAGGSGYSGVVTASASGGSGSGATFTVTVTGGVVTQITMTNPGLGYLATDTVSLVITGTNTTPATGTISLMPFGISGTAVTPYSGHVWVANGAVVYFSAPGSVTDFTTANGGGNFTSTDSFLRVGYTSLLATNGFLYLIGDSSVNYISGVQTSGSPTATTFTNQNADPEVGTPYPATVDVWGRNILFANSWGAHVSYGAAVTKISEPMDGVFSTVPNFGGFAPSAAKAIIFGKKVWILLVPIIDPVTGFQVNKLLMWNGKVWWSSVQGVNLLYIQHQEINSVITAWGTDGLSLFPLFQVPSNAFTKTIQTKLWGSDSYFMQKSGVRLWALAQYFNTVTPALNVSVDNEFGVSTQLAQFLPSFITWVTVTGAIMHWTTSGGAVMNWFVGGIVAFSPQAVGQQGALLGLTLTTNASDMVLISMALQPEIVGYKG